MNFSCAFDYEPKSGKRCFGISVFLHALLGALIIAFAYAKFISAPEKEIRKPDQIFNMLSDAQVAQMQASKTSAAPAPTPAKPIKIEKIEEIKPLNIPPPPPAPTPAKPRPAPDTAPAPPPRAVKAVEAPKQSKPMSYEEYQKIFGKPQPRTTRTTTATPKINPANIGTVSVNAANFTVTRSSQTAAYTGPVSVSDYDAYVAHIASVVEQNWIVPNELTGLSLSVTVRFSINAQGRAHSVKIVRSSGEPALDASILRLFKNCTFRTPPRGETFTEEFAFVTKNK